MASIGQITYLRHQISTVPIIKSNGNRKFYLFSSELNGRNLRFEKVSVFASQSNSQVDSAAADSISKISIPEGFKPPTELRKFTPRGDQWLPLTLASLPAVFRLGMGLFTLGYTVGLAKSSQTQYTVAQFLGLSLIEKSLILGDCKRPVKPIEIYEFEGCPFCRKVREMVAVLDLDVIFYPCPQNGPRYRPEAIKLGGKRQFPYMVDPNKGVSLYESDDIIKYLADTYGNGTIPLLLSLGFLTTLSAGLGLIGRISKGSGYVRAREAPEILEVWGYESSPFTKVVREALCELELAHLFHSVARGSPKRQMFFEEKGVFQVPYLEDPNTGVKMFESAEIVDYLYATYALPK